MFSRPFDHYINYLFQIEGTTVKKGQIVGWGLIVLGVASGFWFVVRLMGFLDAQTEREKGARLMAIVLLVIPLILLIKGVQLIRKRQETSGS